MKLSEELWGSTRAGVKVLRWHKPGFSYFCYVKVIIGATFILGNISLAVASNFTLLVKVPFCGYLVTSVWMCLIQLVLTFSKTNEIISYTCHVFIYMRLPSFYYFVRDKVRVKGITRYLLEG